MILFTWNVQNKQIETETVFMVAQAWGLREWQLIGTCFPFGGNENSLEFIAVMEA